MTFFEHCVIDYVDGNGDLITIIFKGNKTQAKEYAKKRSSDFKVWENYLSEPDLAIAVLPD